MRNSIHDNYRGTISSFIQKIYKNNRKQTLLKLLVLLVCTFNDKTKPLGTLQILINVIPIIFNQKVTWILKYWAPYKFYTCTKWGTKKTGVLGLTICSLRYHKN